MFAKAPAGILIVIGLAPRAASVTGTKLLAGTGSQVMLYEVGDSVVAEKPSVVVWARGLIHLLAAAASVVIAGAALIVTGNGREGPKSPHPFSAVTVTLPSAEIPEKLTVILLRLVGDVGVTSSDAEKFQT